MASPNHKLKLTTLTASIGSVASFIRFTNKNVKEKKDVKRLVTLIGKMKSGPIERKEPFEGHMSLPTYLFSM